MLPTILSRQASRCYKHSAKRMTPTSVYFSSVHLSLLLTHCRAYGNYRLPEEAAARVNTLNLSQSTTNKPAQSTVTPNLNTFLSEIINLTTATVTYHSVPNEEMIQQECHSVERAWCTGLLQACQHGMNRKFFESETFKKLPATEQQHFRNVIAYLEHHQTTSSSSSSDSTTSTSTSTSLPCSLPSFIQSCLRVSSHLSTGQLDSYFSSLSPHLESLIDNGFTFSCAVKRSPVYQMRFFFTDNKGTEQIVEVIDDWRETEETVKLHWEKPGFRWERMD